MKSRLFLAALFFAAASHCFGQVPGNLPDTVEEKPADAAADESIKKRTVSTTENESRIEPVSASPEAVKDPATRIDPPIDYVRPNAKQRFRNYINDVAGPVSLAYYAGTAGLLTLRNSPKEWGDKSDGFGRRFANVAAKHAIRSTTVFALDEALKVDSTFYRSRDRSVAARLRNSVFSAVTARNRRGKRVIGIPAIAGGVLSEVASSSGWYPPRYDYVHGLKGGAISIGITTGINLLKEFVWKPR